MKQFYVDTQGIPELWSLLQEKAKEVGYGLELDFGAETAQTHPIILFDTLCNHYLRLTVEPKEHQEFEVVEALTYFRELKEERKKPKFEVGDWVVSTIQFATTENRGAFQIESIPSESDIRLDTPFPSGSFQPKWLRKATPEEISAAQKIIINGHEMTFDPLNNVVSFGCAKFSKWQFIDLYKFNKGYPFSNRKLVSVKLDSGNRNKLCGYRKNT